MCSNHEIDNRPTVDATPSVVLVVTWPESLKVFKPFTHHQSFTARAPHQPASFLDGTLYLLRRFFSSRAKAGGSQSQVPGT